MIQFFRLIYVYIYTYTHASLCGPGPFPQVSLNDDMHPGVNVIVGHEPSTDLLCSNPGLLGAWGLGFRVLRSLGFRVLGFGFGVWGLVRV